LTTAVYQRRLEPTSQPESSAHRHRRVRVYFVVLAFIACELAGMGALVRAYDIAQTTLSNESEFEWFWLGMCLLEFPLVGLVVRKATPPGMRAGVLTLFGFVSFAPKLLRDPTSPVFHDEFAHWRATYEILSTGKLFRNNPLLHVAAQYPGLHAATAALVHATGLTIWQAATVLLIVFHVTLVLGIAALAQAVGFNNRTASLVAILYGLNSSFLYFDTQYAYESMAITIVVWALTAYVRTIRTRPRQGRVAWGVLTLMLAAGSVVTHHLSTFILLLIMVLVSLATCVPWLAKAEGWAQTARVAWGLTLATGLMFAAWIHFFAPTTLSYLSPYMGQGLRQLIQAATGSGGARQLFGASLSPWWEHYAAYLVTVLAFGLAVGGLLLIRRMIRNGWLPRGRRRMTVLAFVLLGLIYFPSTVFILSPDGAEGARRSWAFSWIGLSMLAALAAVWLIDWAGRSMFRWRRVSQRMFLTVLLAAGLIGGTSAGLSASYRLPGPFLYGSDARSVTPELIGTSSWFSARFGTENNVITDRGTGLVFGSFGGQNFAYPSLGFPTYNLYLAKPGAPLEPPNLLAQLAFLHYNYLVVDARMAYDLPELGVYFVPDEPSSLFLPQDGRPVFHGRLNKFNNVRWAIKVFQSNNYSIYRFISPKDAAVGYHRHLPTVLGRQGTVQRGKILVTP
jgi:hypothetical protein